MHFLSWYTLVGTWYRAKWKILSLKPCLNTRSIINKTLWGFCKNKSCRDPNRNLESTWFDTWPRKENEHLATLLWEGRLLKTHGLPCSWIYEIRDSFYRTPLISLSSTNCPPHFSLCYTHTFLKYNMRTWS